MLGVMERDKSEGEGPFPSQGREDHDAARGRWRDGFRCQGSPQQLAGPALTSPHTYRPEVRDARGGADASARVEHHIGGLPNQLCQLPHLLLQLLRGVEDLLRERAKGSDVIKTCPTVARPLATD